MRRSQPGAGGSLRLVVCVVMSPQVQGTWSRMVCPQTPREGRHGPRPREKEMMKVGVEAACWV